MASDRIIGLDIIRVIAILLVVVFHSTPILSPLTQIAGSGHYFHLLFGFTEPFGLLGVELFFVLSGFLIGSILIKVFNTSEHYGLPEIRSFLVRRWFRTLPNYWLILLANLAVYAYMHPYMLDAASWRYAFFVQNLWYPHPLFFPEAWSLAIEEWFYLTLPFVLLLFSRLVGKESRQRILFMSITFYALLFFVLRVVFTDNSVSDPMYFDNAVRKVVLLRLDAISYGVLVAYLKAYHSPWLMRIRKQLLFTGIAGSVVMTAIHYTGLHPRFDLYHKSYSYRVFHNTVIITLIPVFFSMLLPYAYTVKEIGNKAVSAAVTTISKISYSMYLIHLTLIMNGLGGDIHYSVYNCIPYYIGYWVLTIGLSMLLYKYYEQPTMQLRNQISKKEPAV
jgi:peptidoglycan/LPS O-acetylase OafA/YrhL